MKLKYITKNTLIVIITISSLLLIKGYSMVNLEKNKLYYGVDIDLHNVGVDIRVNGVPVYFDDEKGQLTVEVPAPDSIIDGKNTLSVKAFLPYDDSEEVESYVDGAYIKATLFQQDLSNSDSDKIKISTIFIKLMNEKVQLSTENFITPISQIASEYSMNEDKSFETSVDANIDSPFPQWQWLNGKIIENNKENYTSLLQKYQEIYDALNDKDLSKLKELYSNRSEETAIAYHLIDRAAGHQKLSVGVDMNNNELELYDFHNENMTLQILASGRLARISDDIGAQPILYIQKDGSAVHLYKFMFYLNDKGEWVMIR